MAKSIRTGGGLGQSWAVIRQLFKLRGCEGVPDESISLKRLFRREPNTKSLTPA